MKKMMLLLALVPFAVMAHPPEQGDKACEKGHHMKHHQKGDVPFYLRDLDLTDTQKAQIKALMEKRHADRKAGKAEYWETRKAIHQLVQADTLDEARLEQLVDESMAMKKQAAMQKARFHHEMYQLLTPEQQDKLKAKMEKFKQKHQS
jgi:Spy/CpxP family protein refolding chaperone